MPAEFHTSRRAEFVETDMAGIVHFSNFFRFMEQAEHEFFRSLNLSVVEERDGETITWPRVSAKCDYKRPIYFEDMIEIHLAVVEILEKAVTYRVAFSTGSEVVATGEMTSVCCRITPGHRLKSIPIPEDIRALFSGGAG